MRAVGAEDIVKPFGRFVGIGFRPGVPRADRLRLAVDQTPAPRGDVIFFHHRQIGDERRVIAARHLFGAENGVAKIFQAENFSCRTSGRRNCGT